MELTPKFYDAETDNNFMLYNLSVWVSEDDASKMIDIETLKSGYVYAKITSTQALGKFVIYSRLALLNPRSEIGTQSGYIWLPQQYMVGGKALKGVKRVEIEIVDYSELPLADSVVIDMVPSDMAMWDEKEIDSAIQKISYQQMIAYEDQPVFVDGYSKDVARGKVSKIYPVTKGITLFKITDETHITLTGLPEDKQKVIDFSKIGGLDHVIAKLREIIQIPLTFPEQLARLGVKSPKGMILYGPPGNGKTMIARAVAHSMGSSFVSISNTDVKSEFVGKGERALADKFEEARNKGNCVVFIDEIDSFADKRTDKSASHQISLVGTLLALMDGLNTGDKIFVIAATNRLSAVDPALRRPGRFDLEFEITLPNKNARIDIIKKYARIENENIFEDEVSESFIHTVGELTNGYSGADLSLLYREAAMSSLRRRLLIDPETGKLKLLDDDFKINQQDFRNAVKTVTPTSMRGIDNEVNIVDWNNIIGMKEIKESLVKINKLIENLDNLPEYSNRLSLLNVVLSGEKGSGKRTIVNSFANKFGYEVLSLNMLEMGVLSQTDSLIQIEECFSKAKQISPVIIYISNLDKIQNAGLYIDYIKEVTSNLGKLLRVIVVVSVENPNNIEALNGYKGFDNIITVRDIAKGYIDDILMLLDIERLPNSFKEDSLSLLPIGKAISDITENHLLNRIYEN